MITPFAKLSGFVAQEAFARADKFDPENVVLGNYTFLPYARSGVASALNVPFAWNLPKNAVIDIEVPVLADIDPPSKNAKVSLAVRGPADVLGIDPAQVIRTYPQAGYAAFENEDVVHVEFDRPDFPWLFTPAGPDASGRLVPWLTLVVAERRPGLMALGRPGTLPILSVPVVELQSLDDAWACAHVQTAGPLPAGVDDDTARKEIATRLDPRNAGLNLSRLICPRRLLPNRAYTACLVPTFNAGRQAGLGITVTETTLAPAWEQGADPNALVHLPVYFSFSFATGDAGNFESLARRMKGVPPPPGIGRRRIDMANPGNGIPGISPPSTGREQVVLGPLVTPGGPPVDQPPDFWPSEAAQQWPNEVAATLQTQLNTAAEVLNGTQPAEDPSVGPPIYTNQHLARSKLDGTEPGWFHALNLDPRNRVVAALGARVVQREQEALMASAWNQVEGVTGTNQKLRLAQFARYVGASIHRRHLVTLTPAQQFAITSPVHSRVMSDTALTVRARIDGSALPVAVASAAFRRMTRPLGPIARFAARTPELRAKAVAALFTDNRGFTRDYVRRYESPDGVAEVSPLARSMITDAIAARVFGSDAAVARSRLQTTFASMSLRRSIVDSFAASPPALELGGKGWIASAFANQALGDILGSAPAPGSVSNFRSEAVRAAGHATMVRAFVEAGGGKQRNWSVPQATAQRLGLARAGQAGDVQVSNARLMQFATSLEREAEGWQVHEEIGYERGMRGQLEEMLRSAPQSTGAELALSVQAIASRLAVADTVDVPALPTVHVQNLALASKLDPALTVTARVKGRLGKLPRWLRPGWFDDLRVEPVMAAPSFPFPMCHALCAYDKEWMMAGLAQMKPPDLVTLLEINSAFTETFLLGLNHEFARELLWRGYPTDRRGTCFKSFWTGADELIQPIHQFSDVPLGQHTIATLNQRLVLVARGELIRRYPGVVPRAVRQLQLDENKVPEFVAGPGAKLLFEVHLAPDVLLVAFDLLKDDIVNTSNLDPDHPWWFTLSENPTEPRFGLDSGVRKGDLSRDNLTWKDLGIPDDQALRTTDFLLASTNLPVVDGAKWGSDSAAIAHLLFQLPARAAFLGTRLLTSAAKSG